MSAWEDVPTVEELADLSEDELEEYLDDALDEIPGWHHVNAWHDRDGYYAKEAGSAECVTLGHTEDDYDDGETHPSSFDGELLCLATRFGECCTVCEGECQYNGGAPLLSLWTLPGVLA